MHMVFHTRALVGAGPGAEQGQLVDRGSRLRLAVVEDPVRVERLCENVRSGVLAA